MFPRDRDDGDDVIGERTTLTRETRNGEDDEIPIWFSLRFSATKIENIECVRPIPGSFINGKFEKDAARHENW